MSIENRIKKLEQKTEAKEPKVIIVHVNDSKSEAEAAEAVKRGDTVIEFTLTIDRASSDNQSWKKG